MKDRVILHCDLNCFYASVELLDYPALRDVPVAVCGEMAGDALFTPLLLALGLEEFSLHPGTLLEVRRAVRAQDLAMLRSRAPALPRARDQAGIERWLSAVAAT